jgi:hypothetical protein
VRILTILIFLTVTVNSVWPQPLNYSDIFDEDWKRAEAFEAENRSWMKPILMQNHISYPMAIAVIFPELVRYSALRDKMETTLLKVLYINLGEEYANFSIGHFQMKPSFAEAIREKYPGVLSKRSGISYEVKDKFADIKNFRKSIVTDLEDTKSQINYLIAFIKICEKEFKTDRMDDDERVKFLATAYNYGVGRSNDQIEIMIDRKFFNTKLFSTNNYSYADVSLFWYKNRTK